MAKTNCDALAPVTAMPEIVMVVAPLLVIVTNCKGLQVPTVVGPKGMLVAEKLKDWDAETPVPLNAMVCGESLALSVRVIAAAIGPAEVGSKYPWMEQLDPTARLEPQVLVNANWFALAPPTAILAIDNAAVPELVTVTDC